ncbi:hypothetical protein D4Z78_11765 [Okeania hirsuta]|nr:hypothetical protein D4Z78_11765 [Okeania hirsuta]
MNVEIKSLYSTRKSGENPSRIMVYHDRVNSEIFIAGNREHGTLGKTLSSDSSLVYVLTALAIAIK